MAFDTARQATRVRLTDFHGSAETGSAPLATRIALIATLGVTVAATAQVIRSELTARETAAYLVLFSVLFLLRVTGQLLVVLRAPSWLPPMRQWNLMPYRALLPIQIGFLVLMGVIELGLFHAWGPLVAIQPRFGRFLIGFSFVYAGAMVLRYAARMYRQPRERWFGGAIPIVFHFVLAAFLFTWGDYHVPG
jgi:hypothetical protein